MPAYPVWAYYAHRRQCRCQEDPISLPQQTEKTTRSSPHHVAQHRPTGSETAPPYTPRSSRFGSEPPSVEDDVDIWRYAILELHARNDDDDSAPYNRHQQRCNVLVKYPSFQCYNATQVLLPHQHINTLQTLKCETLYHKTQCHFLLHSNNLFWLLLYLCILIHRSTKSDTDNTMR